VKYPIDPANTALLLLDLQNDFMHPEGAYARGGAGSPEILALAERVAPVADAMRRAGGLVVATLFTLVPGRGGDPMIMDHLRQMRPFLRKGDFAPGSFGQDVIAPLQPVDIKVEKIAYSAFYMSRLEWVLKRAGIRHLICAGIVTNGGVASTVRDAHVREFEITVLEDGCAAMDPATHQVNIDALRSIADVTSCSAMTDRLKALSA